MDIAKYIGETTEYDKKQEVERRKVKSWLKSVSAFANGGGGCLLFGIADDDTIIGLTDAKTDAEFISQKIKERIGNESVVADSTEHKRLVLRGRNSSFDARPSDEMFEDYAFSKLRSRYYAWNGLSFDNKLYRSFGLVDNKGILTYAGLLMADECPLRQSRVFCTRWNGKTKAGGSLDALDSAEITGGLVTLLEDTMSFIRRNNRTLWYKEPMQRIEIPQYMERCVMEVVVNALAHRDYLIQGSEVHVDMYDDRMVIYSPGSMPEGRLIQTMNLEDIPSVRRNPIIADIFAQLGYMERKGSGMGKIINPIKALPYFEEKMFPTFFSDRAQFTVTFPNMILAWQETHPDIEVNFVENEGDTQDVPQGDTQGDTQGVPQDVPQDVPQGVPQDIPQDVPQDVPQGDDLDKWIEYQVAVYPKITTEELALQIGVTSKTIKRRIAKMPHIVYVGSGYSGHWEVKPKRNKR